MRAYHKALELDPQHLDALIGLAESQLSTGKPVLAAATYRKALTINPEMHPYGTIWAMLLRLVKIMRPRLRPTSKP